MPSRAHVLPAFGQADLSNCEREQIHLAGSIQPHGALLLVRETDNVIVQASANAADFLKLRHRVVGATLEELGGNLAERIRPRLSDSLHALPVAVRCHVGRPASVCDVLLHRPAGGGLLIELERVGSPVDHSNAIDIALQDILAAQSLRALCDETARILREITGYDRVMVYRFDDEGHGEVFSEQRRVDLEAFLGNRYPASDIPQMARRLYIRNRVRVLGDVRYQPVPLQPKLSPLTGEELDMSLCALRSMSPIHVKYLDNMGVSATLVVSLVVGSRLWGLIACHHYSPRLAEFELRSVCELLAEAVATRIAALESFLQGQAEIAVRRLEQRMIESIPRDGDWRNALFDSSQSLLQALGASGVALLFEGQIQTAGEVPGTPQLREIGRWLDTRPRGPAIATSSLSEEDPAFENLASVASGLIAAPVSSTPGEYLIWFRPERIRTVTWGGDPFKPVIIGDDPASLSPRRSFSQWHQLVEGTSDPWTPADVTAARLIGDTVADVVLQFRTVRLLIAQDQLDQIRRQVHASDEPVIIAGPDGRILLVNESFQKLLRPRFAALQRLEDLSRVFAETPDVEQRLREMLDQRRTWRGEVLLQCEAGPPTSLLVRADPVFSSPDRVLGFVLLFTDLAERKAASAARQRFQDGIIRGHRVLTGRLDSKADLVFQNLLSLIIENAQLAALEITDGVETARMPELLEGVRASVARTAEVLEHLIWYAGGSRNLDS